MDNVGDVYYFSNKIIVWQLPDFSLLPQNEDCIYSPLFNFSPEYNQNFRKNPAWNFDPLPGHIGLIISSAQLYDYPVNGIKVGVLNRSKKEIGTLSICEFIDDDDSSFFRVRSLIESSKLGEINTSVGKIYICIFAQGRKEVDNNIVNIPRKRKYGN